MRACYMTRENTIRGNNNGASNKPWGGLIKSSSVTKTESYFVTFYYFFYVAQGQHKNHGLSKSKQWGSSEDSPIANISRVYEHVSP
jgi:hypothetical protein